MLISTLTVIAFILCALDVGFCLLIFIGAKRLGTWHEIYLNLSALGGIGFIIILALIALSRFSP